MHLGKAQAAVLQKEMTGVLAIVNVLGIVDNALDVALVVAHFHSGFEMVLHFRFV